MALSNRDGRSVIAHSCKYIQARRRPDEPDLRFEFPGDSNIRLPIIVEASPPVSPVALAV
jgi:hypothetical protein